MSFKVFEVVARLYQCNLGFKVYHSRRDERKQVIAMRLSRKHSRGGGVLDTYTLAQVKMLF
jgi:hypothetical protein